MIVDTMMIWRCPQMSYKGKFCSVVVLLVSYRVPLKFKVGKSTELLLDELEFNKYLTAGKVMNDQRKP